ncbi:mechanosensitive ion channel family protein [Saccharopolyspora sp. 5N708]|uniref:mechanosensitive ion channel family protein n=1 Tax=Saccharopolyspora sp. 5N708 TaxID=3457424 RepID=UPI003FD07541
MGALQQGLAQAWVAVATFVPKLVVFLIIALVGWLIAKAVAKAVQIVFARLGFNRLLAKSGLGDLTSKSNIDVAGVLVKLVYYFILLIFIQLALGVFGPTAIKDLIDTVVLFVPRIVVAIVLVLVAAAIGRVVADLVRSALGSRAMGPVLAKITFGFIVALGAIAALNQIGIALTVTTPVLIAALTAVAGVIVVGVGGGLIKPMQQRWGRWLDTAEAQFAEGSPDAAKNGAKPGADDVRVKGDA